jgi:hypothetical protein
MAYPKLVFDYDKHLELADNIWHAQMAGHPRVLTYNGPDLTVRRQTRREAMHFEVDDESYEIPRILSRDEYPFACTVEGGGGAWVGHIPGGQNSAQGGLIAAFLLRNSILPGQGLRSKFEVEVVHHPNGPVRPAGRQ